LKSDVRDLVQCSAMILAADVGGTSARIATFAVTGSALQIVKQHTYASKRYGSLGDVLQDFLSTESSPLSAACVGIAGPVRGGRVTTPNLPWVVEAEAVAKQLGLKSVALINDLEANAWGIRMLGPTDLLTLNVGEATVRGNAGLISVGTGLGEAELYFDGTAYSPSACEGGHADFAPRDELETGLLRQLIHEFGHVSYERVLSGAGLFRIYCFLRDSGGYGRELSEVASAMQERDPAKVITDFALADRCGLCIATLDLFTSVYGAEAGNVALRFMAVSGVYIGGGIAPKIASKLQSGRFMHSFVAKGRMQSLLEGIPVYLIQNPLTALFGAACFAERHLTDSR
jgi:glucokinase